MPDDVPRALSEVSGHDGAGEVRLPTRVLVVLVGPSGAGKSDWARRHFRDEQIVSSDDLRALVGEGPHDQRAGTDAFDVLDLVLERRLRRGLLTVIDSLGLDTQRRRGWIAAARRHGMACHAVAFDTPAKQCRARNRQRERPVPPKVLTAQLGTWEDVRDRLHEDGFDAVHVPGPVSVVPAVLLDASVAARRQRQEPVTMRFGLQISSFQWPGRPAATAERLRAMAHAAEEVGFSSLWLMDHVLQVPQVGREWEDLPDSYTTLGYLAAVTQRCRLGVLVTAVTFRNVAHLAKIVATLDVLSGGRAMCGLGAAWYRREHDVYGWDFPATNERYALLEDALQLLPLMWGPGAPAFNGEVLHVPESICYPRPMQERVPILVGGGGERRTLRLVAKYADACNFMGEPDTVRHKLEVLRSHCEDLGRDPATIEVTHLTPLLVTGDRAELAATVERLRGPSQSPEAFLERVFGGTVDDHVGRFRQLADAGVDTAIVSLAGITDPAPIERFGDDIAAFDGATADDGAGR
jgi:F420-dependent oxidoreductase-like protein